MTTINLKQLRELIKEAIQAEAWFPDTEVSPETLAGTAPPARPAKRGQGEHISGIPTGAGAKPKSAPKLTPEQEEIYKALAAVMKRKTGDPSVVPTEDEIASALDAIRLKEKALNEKKQAVREMIRSVVLEVVAEFKQNRLQKKKKQ